MNKFIVALVAANLTVSFCSCGNNTTKNDNSGDTTSTDTLNENRNVEHDTNAEKPNRTAKRLHTLPKTVILQDNTPNQDEFTSNDRKTFNLRGNVKECKKIEIFNNGYEHISEHLSFDQKGRYKNISDYEIELKRNSKGFISSIKIKEGFGGETFIYDKEGRVTMHGAFGESGAGEFFYKYLGYTPLESYLFGEIDYDTGKTMEYGSPYPYRGYSYEYLKFDDHGNWTLRNVKIEEFEGEPEIITYKEKRVIIYY